MLIIFLIVTVVSSNPAAANESALTLPKIIEYSLHNNGDLKSLREEKGIRDAGKVKAGLLPNPTLDLEASTGALTGSNNENSLGFGLSQEFLLAGKRDKRLTIAERELEVYRWLLADRERLLREEVKTAFYDTVLAKERLALSDRAIVLNRQLLDVTKERLAAGDVPELEMNLVKVELARSESIRIEFAKAMLQSQAKLKKLMGVAPNTRITLSGQLDSTATMTKSLDELTQFACAKRPDLRALDAEKAKADAEMALAQAEQIPNLTVGLFYAHQERADKTGVGEENVRDNILGLRFSMPIPVFDRNQVGIQEARAKRTSNETRLATATRNVTLDVETAYAIFQDATTILNLYHSDILPQFDENLKLTQEAYRIGEVGILTVIQEQKKFFEVNDGYLAALHDQQTALVKLESVTASELTGGEK